MGVYRPLTFTTTKGASQHDQSTIAPAIDLAELIQLRDEYRAVADELSARLAQDDPDTHTVAVALLDREVEIIGRITEQFRTTFDGKSHRVEDLLFELDATGDLGAEVDQYRDRLEDRAVDELIVVFERLCERRSMRRVPAPDKTPNLDMRLRNSTWLTARTADLGAVSGQDSLVS